MNKNARKENGYELFKEIKSRMTTKAMYVKFIF